jgi:Carbohydrate binding module (family 6)
VDIKTPTDGPTVGWTANGEWLSYDLNVAVAGTYIAALRVANGLSTNASLHFELDGTNVTGTIPVAPTGCWSAQAIITGPTIDLTTGSHILKVVFDVARLTSTGWTSPLHQPQHPPPPQ